MTLKNRVKIPIILYHDVVPQAEMKNVPRDRRHYTLSAENFKAQMAYLKKTGRKGIDFSTFYSLVQTDAKLLSSDRYVVLTFDDGHVSQARWALPILKEFGFTASFFLISNWVGTPGFVSEKEVRGLVAAGMDVQSHTANHTFLMELNSHQAVEELVGSKKRLERLTGKPVRFLSLPGGRSDRSVWQLCGIYGYEGILTSLFGYGNFQPFWEKVHANGYVPHGYYRLAMSRGMHLSTFRHLIENKGWLPRYFRWRNQTAKLAKTIVGHRTYHKIWLWVFGSQGETLGGKNMGADHA